MKRLYAFLLCIAVAVAVAAALPLEPQVTFSIDAGRAGAAIGPLHYGLFFEEINHAGDGGLYAELVRNRSFEDNASAPDYWNAISGATLSLSSEGLLNEAQSRCLRTSITQSNGGFKNSGYWGMSIVRGETYTFSAWVRAESTYNGRITVQLLNSSNSAIGSASINVQLTEEWQKIEASVTATATATSGSMGLRCSKPGVVMWDVVSLMPPTYKDRPNGCRRDLAELLASMHPRFMRFPGGCYVEGQARDGQTNRFEWKKTIGPIEQRPGHWNVNWNYRVSDGLGFHEMLQLAEDLGAAPLFVVNIGLGHGWYQAYDDLDEYIQEALDALEYANGDGSTEWGARRIAAGHPEPFNLKLIEIGNENYNFTSTNNSDQSDHYAERYRQFYDAIKARYPDVVCIGNVESWGTDAPSWRNDNPVEVVDEHYYRSPSWFAGQYNKYDGYDRAKYKVYAGEYAVTQDFGTNGHLTAALGEAIYMLGMERNSDVCIMASYAPIFVNENDQLWRPDMIRFNSTASYGTPSYWVQHMMSNNIGAQNVQFTESGNSDNMEHQAMGLSTWSTAARFDNLVVTDASGNVLLSDDFEAQSGLWTDNGGTWRTSGGLLTQGSTSMQGSIFANSTDLGENYTISLQATKTAGDEGFLIAFRMSDTSNYCWWNLGGWGNTQHAVEWCRQGAKQTVAATPGSLVTGQTYDIRI